MLLISLTACNPQTQPQQPIANDVVDPEKDPFDESPHKACNQQLADFFYWYAVNNDSIGAAQNAIISTVPGNDTLYAFSARAAKRYIQLLRSANHFAPAYIDSLERMIFDKAQRLPAAFPPEAVTEIGGFDAEFILSTQDPQLLIEEGKARRWEFAFLGGDHWKAGSQAGSFSIRVDSTTCRIKSINWGN